MQQGFRFTITNDIYVQVTHNLGAPPCQGHMILRLLSVDAANRKQARS